MKDSAANSSFERGSGVSRRNFIKLGGLALFGLASGAYLKQLDGLYANGTEDEWSQSIEGAIKYLGENYGIEVFTGVPEVTNFFGGSDVITGTDLSRYELSSGLELAIGEIVKYPYDFFRNNSISNIRFINDVRVNGEDYSWGYGASSGTLGIAYSAEEQRLNSGRFREVFHHEAFHGFDWFNGGYKSDDKEWENIHNCKCEVYWNVGGRDSIENVPEPDSPIEWFVNPYGRLNPVEDRATTAQYMMIPYLHRLIIERIGSERNRTTKEILQKKRSLIMKDYADWSGGVMNDQYWDDLVNDKVKMGYFD